LKHLDLHRLLLPPGTTSDAAPLLAARALRAFGDGFVSLLLPYYLTLLGYNAFQIGLLVTATLLGSGLLTLGVGFIAHRHPPRRLLYAGSLLMAATGIATAVTSGFWPLLVVAVVGTLNPAANDVTPITPLEQTLLARATGAESRTALFARHSLIGALVAALGAQAAGLPELAGSDDAVRLAAVRAMFLLYAGLGLASFLLYRRLSPLAEHGGGEQPVALGPSRGIVYRLAALFSLDSFAGGFAVQSLLALWLFQRFDLTVSAAATIFFWTGLLTAFSHLAAVRVARRFGLVNTMVFTHLPANLFLILVPLMPTLELALLFLLLRSALSSMDVPVRTSYVMAVVTPGERPAAASLTAVPRSLASALSPTLAGALLAASPFGWPLVICGTLKIVYDLTLLRLFSRIKPPEER
jgi:MFS family permease